MENMNKHTFGVKQTALAYFVPAKSGKYVDATPVPDDYEAKH